MKWDLENWQPIIEQLPDFNKAPTYLVDLLTYKLTTECIKRINEAQISGRQLVPQLYRLLGSTNTSMKQLMSLLNIVDCKVDMVNTPCGEPFWSLRHSG